ncbi:MAG: 30S ribosomal protein S17e [Candidatus Korarchaeota archaeon]
MGRVRPSYIKRMARELLSKYPNRFNNDFENNKKAVRELLANDPHWKSKKDKNRVSGYITHLVKIGYLIEKKKALLLGEMPTEEELAAGEALEKTEG